jgi:hypothetical protein
VSQRMQNSVSKIGPVPPLSGFYTPLAPHKIDFRPATGHSCAKIASLLISLS